jgi:hypothetical protein
MLGVLLAVLWLAGCANPGPRSRYLEQIEPGSLPNLIAYRGVTNLEIRYPFHGRDAYAIASWSQQHDGTPDFDYRYAVLAFDKQPRATRRSLAKRGTRLVIRNAKQWQALVEEVVLVMVQNQEIALCRDKAGTRHVVKLEEKPADVTIDHAFGQSDFSRKAIELLEKSAKKLEPGQSQFLFVTDEETAFVLIDLRARLIVFLSYPIDPDTQPSDLPGWFRDQRHQESLHHDQPRALAHRLFRRGGAGGGGLGGLRRCRTATPALHGAWHGLGRMGEATGRAGFVPALQRPD